jgi:hypothetical protein
MKYAKINFTIILVTSAFILVPSFALISSSQTNETSSEDTSSDDMSSNPSTFSNLSREFANQSESEGQSGEDDE